MEARSGLNSFALVFDENYETEYHMSTACLAGIDNTFYDYDDEDDDEFEARKTEMPYGPLCFFVDNPFQKARKTDKHGEVNIKFNRAQRAFLTWLSKKSVWAGCFITKNPNIMAKKGIVYNVDYPAKFVYQAAVLPRYVAEFPSNVLIWKRLTKFVEPHLAIAMCHSMNIYKKTKFRVKYDGTTNNNHQAWKSAEVGVEEIKKMVRHDIDLSRWDAMAINTHYRNVKTLWRLPFSSPVQVFKWPKGNEVIIKDKWGDSWVEITHNWSELREFVQEFLKINKLEELYYGE